MAADREPRTGEGRGTAAGRRGKGVIWLGAAVQDLVERSGLYLLAGNGGVKTYILVFV
jgi:hypothetical protein